MGLIVLLTWVAILVMAARSSCPGPGPTPADDILDRAAHPFFLVSLGFFPVNLVLAIVAGVVANRAHWSRSTGILNFIFAVLELVLLLGILVAGAIIGFAQMNRCGPL